MALRSLLFRWNNGRSCRSVMYRWQRDTVSCHREQTIDLIEQNRIPLKIKLKIPTVDALFACHNDVV